MKPVSISENYVEHRMPAAKTLMRFHFAMGVNATHRLLDPYTIEVNR